jgi:cyclopropane-fatty-acyl-phospholipid synthase
MMEWFEGLGVDTERLDMSFSVSALLDRNGSCFEWGSHNGMSGLLAQKRNSLSPSFWRLIVEIFKFKNHALK